MADLVLFSDLKNFDFEGPKSEVEIFKSSQERGIFSYIFKAIFLVNKNGERAPEYMFLNRNFTKIRFLKS